jgi:hypothetical protein
MRELGLFLFFFVVLLSHLKLCELSRQWTQISKQARPTTALKNNFTAIKITFSQRMKPGIISQHNAITKLYHLRKMNDVSRRESEAMKIR